MVKIPYQVIVIGIIAIIGFFIAVRAMTPEDTWICNNGQWIKHGNPANLRPASLCK